MKNDIKKVLYSEKELSEVVSELGAQISEDYKDRNLLMVSVLKGSIVFMSDLMRAVTIPCEIDFMAVSSYGNKTKSSGTVRILKDLDRDISGYDVLLVEDILDSGKTLNYLMDVLYARNPASIRICTLFDKPERREVDIFADYKGLSVPDEFIVGYGLDFAEKYRNLPYIGVLKDDKH
ncbi:MAG: hypoxanthine phosphoribosyltransferase [Clostridia bacterium]|nr:hypoxanthine phosphoribosyltransferase [Clostridia bacterium]